VSAARTVLALFPGQGAEEPRMGVALAEAFPPARALLALAGEEAGVEPLPLLARGGAALARTEVLQPLLVAVALGAWKAAAAAGVSTPLVAGHSLGELAAWCAAGGIGAEDAVRLAARRGRLMADAAARSAGGMVAYADEAAAEAALAAGRPHGAIGLAARNAPDEWVVSGPEAALAAALRAVPGGRRLRVAGAWHSLAMAGAVDPFREAARAAATGRSDATFLSGVTGAPAGAVHVPELLADALVAPVRFAELLAGAAARGVTDAVVLGPSKVMRGLVRRALGAVRIHLVCDAADAARVAEALAA
jgi:[acyl-carrier-protein] S-malonyltransferase